MYKFLLCILMTAVFFIQGCKKDNNEIPEPTGDPVSKTLVRSIEWDNGTKAVMEYNTDSTLKKINYSFQHIVAATIFNWESKQLKEMYDDRSWYKNVFYFNGNKLSYYINLNKQGASPDKFKMEYVYNSNGTLASLKHYTTNEAGTILKATSSYSYDAAGDLEEVVTQTGNNVFTHTISGYSEVVDFDPLIFMEYTVSENYSIYNFPLLSSLKKLPQKIVRKVKIGNDNAYIDKIDTNTYEITNRQLNKITTSITIPGMPQYSNTVSAVFNYSG